jgi:hypothetical protein
MENMFLDHLIIVDRVDEGIVFISILRLMGQCFVAFEMSQESV